MRRRFVISGWRSWGGGILSGGILTGGILTGVGLLGLTACGGSGANGPVSSPASAVEEPAPEPREAHDLSTSAEVGGLNAREAEQSFRDSLEGLQACVSNGVERLEFMGGSIEFAVKIDTSRRAARVWAAQSSLGERTTEKCMFDALRAVTWPAPVGGDFGIARNSFEFEVKKGVPAPAIWDAGRVASVVNAVDGPLHQCRGSESGRLLITLYIGPGGKALAGGAASEDPLDDAAVDCVVDTLLAAEYPRPERAPTKVRFQL
jgi:hypothetical protein